MFRRRFIAVGFAACLAACGGGGGSSGAPSSAVVPSAPGPASPGSSSLARATFTITVPKSTGSSAARSPKYIASNTQSIKFTLLKTDATGTAPGPQTFVLSGSQSYCQSSSSGLTCTLAVSAPVGNDIYDAETFADAAATQKIGGGAVAMDVKVNANNTATITLGGPIAAAGIIAPQNCGTNGSTYLAAYGNPAPLIPGNNQNTCGTNYSSVRSYIVAVDTNGNQILSPDSYSSPVYLTPIDQYSSNNYVHGYGKARKPLDVPATAGLGNGAQILTITITHPDGTQSVSTPANPSVPVTSTGDVITMSATPGFADPNNNSRYVFATVTVGATPTPMPSSGLYDTGDSASFFVAPAQCPSGWTGTEATGCASPTPAATPTPVPSPSPSPCPSGMYGNPCVTPSLSWIYSSGPRTFSGTDETYEFTSLTDPSTPVFSLQMNDATYGGPITLKINPSDTSGACNNLLFNNVNNGSAPTMPIGTGIPINASGSGASYNPYTWYFSVAINQSPAPGAGFTCHLQATGEGSATATLEVYANNVTGGSIQ